MSKKCAKCEKTVYPLEELKCLDKIWHKACFRCWECGMTLNMKNYKGYDKKPYCNAHYPQTKHTQVADTPEARRLAQNTKLQSQIQYHEDFEKSKGRYTAVTDDPETLRLLKNQNTISSIKYHEDFERMKGTKTSVVDDPETQRHKQNTQIASNVEYHGLRNKQTEMENRRQYVDQDNVRAHQAPPGSISNYNPMPPDDHAPSPYSAKSQGGQRTVYSAGGRVEEKPTSQRSVGSIADYDPLNEQFGSIAKGYGPASTVNQKSEWEETIPEPKKTGYRQQQKPDQAHYPAGQAVHQPVQHHQPAPVQQQQQQYRQPQPAPVMAPPTNNNNPLAGAVYKAMYDYDAADDDEVSFRDGDDIINPEPIDEGWMYGTVKRTGHTGMLPANYVERVK